MNCHLYINIADRSACIWGVATGKCLLRYSGHGGSVNSARFHPSRDVILSASGDCTAHVWQAAVDWEVPVIKLIIAIEI